MAEQGFFASLEERLFQRLHLLWRAVRIVLDVGLHTRGMTPDQAVDMLVDRVAMDRDQGPGGGEPLLRLAHLPAVLCGGAARVPAPARGVAGRRGAARPTRASSTTRCSPTAACRSP